MANYHTQFVSHFFSLSLLTCLNLTCSHDAMLNPVYVPPDALEEMDAGKTIEDDDEITVNKGALDVDPDDTS